jgi:hypothetical protein
VTFALEEEGDISEALKWIGRASPKRPRSSQEAAFAAHSGAWLTAYRMSASRWPPLLP